MLSRSSDDPAGLSIDPLTGLRGEPLFHLSFPQEFALARDREAKGALLIVKLDNIIAINGMHGRAGGDEALRAIAQILESVRAAPDRATHSIFKMSGPLFGYYIPTCSAPTSRSIAEEMLQRAWQSELYIGRLTVSIGIGGGGRREHPAGERVRRPQGRSG